MKHIVILAMLLLPLAASSQDWEERSLPGISFEFPKPNSIQNASNGSAVTYEGGDVFLTVTILPEDSEFRPSTKLEHSRYYSSKLNNVLLRLHGTLKESRDTLIGDKLMHYSSAQVPMSDSTSMVYDMLQYYRNDSLIAFSCQYDPLINSRVKMRNRFYKSIEFDNTSRENDWFDLYRIPLLIVASLVMIAVILGFIFGRIRRR